MVFCGQCGKMFHVGCLRHHAISDIKERPSTPDGWLCGENCEEVCRVLVEFLHGGSRPIPNAMLNSLKSVSVNRGLLDEAGDDQVQWQLLSGRFQNGKNSSLLDQVITIFQEAFYVVRKRNCDVLSLMVKGEKGIAEFFGGIFCAILTIKSSIVSAALLRVFGRHVAELSLAVTAKERRREGYFKILLLKIEELLSFLKVETLILPADDNTISMWMNKFGFSKLEDEKVLKHRMTHRIVMFEGTTMLQKAINPLHDE